jgi:hypothetical protein
VRQRVLAICDVDAARREAVACVEAPLDADDGVVGAVADRDGHAAAAVQVELEPLDGGDEPAEREDASRPGAAGSQPQCV